MSPGAGGPAGCLPVAIEVMTAYTDSADDPGFFWQSVQRVMADGAGRSNPAEAMAELVLGLSALCGITLDDLAERSGPETGPREVLAAIRRAYVTDPAT
ncbi:hypothetical protein [Frankia sp. CiP3]|uniref:hypothetical protein n=1 Tax=Frankia sp. CiP3 TaxID=2880971 RepID=UPI001EF63371|nr:hypothetical protein [Frankia sp. CiP3]